MKKSILFLTTCLLCAFMVSCNDDDEDLQLGGNGDILVVTYIVNTDGSSGLQYMQLIDNMDTTLTNDYSYSVPYSSAPCISGDNIYTMPGWGGGTEYLKKYCREDGDLTKQWEYLLPTSSGATCVVEDGDLIYVACAYTAQILVINHTDASLVADIDISDYGVGDQNPDAGSMVLRDGYLYVGLQQMVGGYYAASDRPYSDVLIIDTESNEVLKMITDNTSNISTPTRPIDPNSIFVDDNNDIYIVCLGAFGAYSNHYAGILRINDGETEFDPDYHFILSTASIDGEENNLNYLAAVKYFGDDKLYAAANLPALYGDPVDYVEDRTIAPVEIDLANQTIKAIGLPYTNTYGFAVGEYDGQVIFGLATTTDNGYYTYDPETEEISESAVVTCEGYPSYFYSFE